MAVVGRISQPANTGLLRNGGGSPIKAKLFSSAGEDLHIQLKSDRDSLWTDDLNFSAGSVDNYTNCCLYVILQHQQEYVQWPDATKRCSIKSRIGQGSFFKSCVGFINGTLINLAAAPNFHEEDYWTRKSVYALNSLVICNDQQKVIYAHHGWCGTAHDQRVLKSTRVRCVIAPRETDGSHL